jgi:hypothetical protein
MLANKTRQMVGFRTSNASTGRANPPTALAPQPTIKTLVFQGRTRCPPHKNPLPITQSLTIHRQLFHCFRALLLPFQQQTIA